MLRPKVFKTKGGQVFTVTPGKVAQTEALIREFVRKEANCKFGREVPLKLKAVFHLPKPASLRKRVYPVVRPDLDQYLKLLMDSLTKYLWEDDAQIVEINASKVYDSLPRIKLEVEPLA